MKVIIGPTAQRQIDHQLQFSVEKFGLQTAEKNFGRVEFYFAATLANFPRTGRRLSQPNLYESMIARTPFVVIYRIEPEHDTVRVLGFYHYAQDRDGTGDNDN